MIHMVTILQRTPGNIHRNSANCRSKVTASVINSDAGGEHFLVKGLAMDPTTTKTNYRMVVKLYLSDKGLLPNNPKVFIWCGCPWFKYFCEVALAIRGSSYIINSNGALPKITNPTAKPQVCKHCLAFLRKIKSQPELLKSMAVQRVKASARGNRPEDAHIDDLMVSHALAHRKGQVADIGSLGTRTL